MIAQGWPSTQIIAVQSNFIVFICISMFHFPIRRRCPVGKSIRESMVVKLEACGVSQLSLTKVAMGTCETRD